MLLADDRDAPGFSADVPPIVVAPNMPVVVVPPVFDLLFENCPHAVAEPAITNTAVVATANDKRMGHLHGDKMSLLPVSTIHTAK
jgi:hypothetical protein